MAEPRVDTATTLTRVELDSVTCSCGRDGCPTRNVGVRARCHPDAGLTVGYLAVPGHLVLACKACGIGIARIQVAWGLPS